MSDKIETIDIGPGRIVAYPAKYVEKLSDEVDRLSIVVARVRGLHQPDEIWVDGDLITICEYCSYEEYPCKTIRILDGATLENDNQTDQDLT